MSADKCYPYHLRDLAAVRDTCQHHRAGKRAEWILYVAGPFCFWPYRVGKASGYRANTLAGSLSNMLALPVQQRIENGAVHLRLVLSQDERDYLIRNNYLKETGNER